METIHFLKPDGSLKKKSVITASTANMKESKVKPIIAAAHARKARMPRYVNPSIAMGDRFLSISS